MADIGDIILSGTNKLAIPLQNPADTMQKWQNLTNSALEGDNLAITNKRANVQLSNEGQASIAKSIVSLRALSNEQLTPELARQTIDQALQNGHMDPKLAQMWHQSLDRLPEGATGEQIRPMLDQALLYVANPELAAKLTTMDTSLTDRGGGLMPTLKGPAMGPGANQIWMQPQGEVTKTLAPSVQSNGQNMFPYGGSYGTPTVPMEQTKEQLAQPIDVIDNDRNSPTYGQTIKITKGTYLQNQGAYTLLPGGGNAQPAAQPGAPQTAPEPAVPPPSGRQRGASLDSNELANAVAAWQPGQGGPPQQFGPPGMSGSSGWQPVTGPNAVRIGPTGGGPGGGQQGGAGSGGLNPVPGAVPGTGRYGGYGGGMATGVSPTQQETDKVSTAMFNEAKAQQASYAGDMAALNNLMDDLKNSNTGLGSGWKQNLLSRLQSNLPPDVMKRLGIDTSKLASYDDAVKGFARVALSMPGAARSNMATELNQVANGSVEINPQTAMRITLYNIAMRKANNLAMQEFEKQYGKSLNGGPATHQFQDYITKFQNEYDPRGFVATQLHAADPAYMEKMLKGMSDADRVKFKKAMDLAKTSGI